MRVRRSSKTAYFLRISRFGPERTCDGYELRGSRRGRPRKVSLGRRAERRDRGCGPHTRRHGCGRQADIASLAALAIPAEYNIRHRTWRILDTCLFPANAARASPALSNGPACTVPRPGLTSSVYLSTAPPARWIYMNSTWRTLFPGTEACRDIFPTRNHVGRRS